jgi:hypothetical protein
VRAPDITDVTVDGDELRVKFADGRRVRAPIAAFPALRGALPQQRDQWRLIGGGVGIHWEELDEDISASSLVSGKFRFDITSDDLRRYSWQEMIDGERTKQCNSYFSPLYRKAQELEKELDYVGAGVFRLLGAVASFHPNYDTAGNPFGPLWRERDKRALRAEDLSDEDISALAEIIAEIRDPEFRARVADVVWETKRDHNAARTAVRAYLESAQRLQEADMWPPFVERLERALQLTVKLSDRNLREDVLATIERIIEKYKDDTAAGLMAARLMESLLPFRSDKAQHYGALSESLAKQFAQLSKWDFAEQYWQTASSWYRKAKQHSDFARTDLEAAECIANKAEENLRSANPSYGFAAHWMGRAVEALRQAKAAPERIDTAHRRFIELEQLGTSELKSVELRYDEIPGLTAQINEQIRLSRSHVEGRRFDEALLKLAFIVHPVDPNRLRERLRKRMADSPFLSLFGSVALTASGKVADTSPPLSSTVAEEQDKAMVKHMFLQARELDWPNNVRFAIEPARRQIAMEHPIRLRDLAFLVSYNPFIPAGRAGIYARGIQAGFFGDWLVAIHLLIPQLEASIRWVFEQVGIPTSTLESDGSQKERDLGWLLNHEKTAEIFGVATAFDLRGLLTEKFGHNLRNDSAHGLMPEAAFYTEASEYVWWLTIRLCCIGLRALQHGSNG